MAESKPNSSANDFLPVGDKKGAGQRSEVVEVWHLTSEIIINDISRYWPHDVRLVPDPRLEVLDWLNKHWGKDGIEREDNYYDQDDDRNWFQTYPQRLWTVYGNTYSFKNEKHASFFKQFWQLETDFGTMLISAYPNLEHRRFSATLGSAVPWGGGRHPRKLRVLIRTARSYRQVSSRKMH